MDTVGPHSGYCGSWAGGTWTPSGRCTDETTTVTTTTSNAMAPAMATGGMMANPDGRTPGRVAGTITFVKGHLVTLQQSEQSIVIDDQTALDMHKSGRIANGRSVTAHGYWKTGTFYATRFE
jgi:hypothetical protein